MCTVDWGNEETELKQAHVLMLRERINLHGFARPMEPEEDIPCLQIPPDQIGLLKEAPAMRWFRGQNDWDARFRKKARRVQRKREEHKRKASEVIKHAHEMGLVHAWFPESMPVERETGRRVKRTTSIGGIDNHRRWGPLDLDDERPPPSAIAGRRDTVSFISRCLSQT